MADELLNADQVKSAVADFIRQATQLEREAEKLGENENKLKQEKLNTAARLRQDADNTDPSFKYHSRA